MINSGGSGCQDDSRAVAAIEQYCRPKGALSINEGYQKS